MLAIGFGMGVIATAIFFHFAIVRPQDREIDRLLEEGNETFRKYIRLKYGAPSSEQEQYDEQD